MALTKDFKDTIQARAQRDPAFRKALLQEGVECLLADDIDTGKAVLRDYINATSGSRNSPRSSTSRARVSCACSGRKGIPRRATCLR